MSESRTPGKNNEIKIIKRLVKLMEDAGLTELDVESEGVKVRLKKGGTGEVPAVVMPPQPPSPQTVQATAEAESQAAAMPESPAAAAKNVYVVRSPMVGTFYRAPSPQSAPFVNAGDSISEGQTLCLIEAMKLMNELKSEKAGKVLEILVDNGLPVEFDQPLMEIELLAPGA